ncbi:MAG: DUF2961 domain-containing protein, partial [Clostridiales bacterium]|nr:DUF2961 domain-containing protein [Clostridiales bacterium]
MPYPLDGLCTLRTGVKTKRISSFDRTGGNGDCRPIAQGATEILAQIQGAGIIRHIWFTIACDDPMYRRHLILRMFWNGEEHPSVECPVGDFF